MATPAQIQLNRRLTRAETPAEILEVVQKDLQQFNLVNCTTALHRYAKAISQGGCGPHHDAGQERTPKPLGRLLQHLAEMVAKGKAVPAQNLANALWAIERLGLTAQTAAVCAVCNAAREALAEERQMWGFTGQNLANSAWAVAKLLNGRGAAQLLAGRTRAHFFEPFVAALDARAGDLNGQELSMAAWSLGHQTGDPRAAGALQRLAEVARAWDVRNLSAQQLATLSWALARLDCRDEAILTDLASAAAPSVARGEFNAQDLSNIAWAFGRLQPQGAPGAQGAQRAPGASASASAAARAKLLQRLQRAVLPLCRVTEPKRPTSRAARESERGFSAQQMAVLAWSLARLGAAPATLTAVVEAVAARISELSPRDLTDVVWALGHAGVQHSDFLKQAGHYAQLRRPDFGTQEMLRFLGAFRRAGGDASVQQDLASQQQELVYDFPAMGLKVTLHAETPGLRGTAAAARRRTRVRRAALREREELGGDPQRADGGTTGVAVWEASFVLAEWISHLKGLACCQAFQELVKEAGEPSLMKRWRSWGHQVAVELGAGLGLPAIVAAHRGLQRVVATDGDSCVMKLLRENVEINQPASGGLSAVALLWGAEDPVQQLQLTQPADLLLAADVIYASAKEALNKQLLETMLKLTHPDSVVILGNVRRFHQVKKGEQKFLQEAERLFHRTAVPSSELHPDFQRMGLGSCEIHLLCIRRAQLVRSPPGATSKAKTKQVKSLKTCEPETPTAPRRGKRRRSNGEDLERKKRRKASALPARGDAAGAAETRASGLLKGAEEALSELKTKAATVRRISGPPREDLGSLGSDGSPVERRESCAVNELKNGLRPRFGSAGGSLPSIHRLEDFKLQDFERRVTTLSRKRGQTQLENNTKAKDPRPPADARLGRPLLVCAERPVAERGEGMDEEALGRSGRRKEAMEAAMAEKKIVVLVVSGLGMYVIQDSRAQSMVSWLYRVEALLKHHQKAKTLTTEDLVKEMAKEEDQISKATAFGEGGQMVRKRDAFVAFVGACEKDDGVEVTEEEIGTFFEAQDVEKEDFLTKERRVSKVYGNGPRQDCSLCTLLWQEHMLMLVRTLKKVVKETTMTEGLDISESTVMTKLEATGLLPESVGEVVELLSEPSEQGPPSRRRTPEEAHAETKPKNR
ncbi:unnamed protein product [Durusdinium trenchii]|uniref:Calmodulin-lysine N-methyltransferase n=1 Tax=Durusdinium trenchii TaxID=1381693 RepID=A0ABP0JZJ9_9DINO